MADGSNVRTRGKVKIQQWCGKYRGVVQAKVFPGLQKDIILGMPWLQKENPRIDWTQPVVLVQQAQKWVQLPSLKGKKEEPSMSTLNWILAKQMSRIFKAK